MDRLFGVTGNCEKNRTTSAKPLNHVKFFGGGSALGALCLLAVVLLLALPFAARQKAQPAFFSMLFPQLVPEFAETESAPLTWWEWCFGEAVEL